MAWIYAAVIVYASLYPFAGWRAVSSSAFAFLAQPFSRYWIGFDVIANLVGYLPLGALMFFAMVRSNWHAGRAALAASVLAALLSLTLETLQSYLPQRVPSKLDLMLNVAGGLAGVALAALVHWRGGVERWQRARDRWFVARSAGGVALLILWPIGLLFPTAVPFGLGHVLARGREVLDAVVRNTPIEGWIGHPAPLPIEAVPLAPGAELAIIVLGLVAPCLVAFTIAMPGWRRVVLVVVGCLVGAATTTLSTALNFGPSHAFAWITATSLQAFAIGVLAGALLSLLPARAAAGFGLVALTALVMLVQRAPTDPYFAQSLQAWEQGRFIRLHGAAQWVGWLWPYVALVYLLVRVAIPDPKPVATAR
nr:VanZ family protein [Schlegelella koreensis]